MAAALVVGAVAAVATRPSAFARARLEEAMLSATAFSLPMNLCSFFYALGSPGEKGLQPVVGAGRDEDAPWCSEMKCALK